jgi:aminoglycoside phosphotransferase (APT) family kinase protein
MLDAQGVLALVAEVLGERPRAATRMTFGHSSVVYDVALPARQVIVRLNERAAVFAGTARNLAILARLGLPMPRLLAADLTAARWPVAYLILEKIPGRDLRYELTTMSPAQLARIAEQIVSFQRRVATLPPGAGFGWAPIGERGAFSSWWELIQRDLGKAAPTDDAVVAEWAARVAGLARRLAPYLARVPPTCFLDDVTTKNVIVRDGELRGLVDFDVVCYGDPLFTIGLTAAAIVSDVGTRELFYVEELCRCWGLTAEQRRAVALYSALHALDFLQRAKAEETDAWTARMLGALRRWATAAE